MIAAATTNDHLGMQDFLQASEFETIQFRVPKSLDKACLETVQQLQVQKPSALPSELCKPLYFHEHFRHLETTPQQIVSCDR